MLVQAALVKVVWESFIRWCGCSLYAPHFCDHGATAMEASLLLPHISALKGT